MILSLPAFYTLFCRDWVWVFKGFFQKYLFFLLGTLLVREKVEKKAGILAAVGACSFAALVLEICFFPVEIYDNPYIDLGMSYVDNAITVGICLGILAEIRCGTICIISRFAVPCWGCFCMRSCIFLLWQRLQPVW